MEFKASLDPTAKLITIGITVLFAVLAIWPIVTITDDGVPSAIYVPAILGIIYFGSFIYSPQRYAIVGNSLVVHRPIGKVTIPISSIRNIEKLSKGMPFAIRTFGVGGLFGYFGTFLQFRYGQYAMVHHQTRPNVMYYHECW